MHMTEINKSQTSGRKNDSKTWSNYKTPDNEGMNVKTQLRHDKGELDWVARANF